MSECSGCKVKPRIYPYHCYCGKVHQGKSKACKLRPRPRTVGSILREMVGCGCSLAWRKWDRLGLQWCRDNAEQIAQRLTAEPRPAIPIDRARELVRLAIEIASRQAGDGQQAS